MRREILLCQSMIGSITLKIFICYYNTIKYYSIRRELLTNWFNNIANYLNDSFN